MAFVMRKLFVNLKNVNKCRKLCLFVQSKRLQAVRYCGAIHLHSIEDNKINHRYFHTTKVLNKTVAFKLSDIGEGIREVVIKEWFIKVGDKVQQFDNICEVQSDKAAVTITSRYDGVITKIYHEVDQTALVGQPLVDIDLDSTPDEESSSDSDTENEVEVSKTQSQTTQKVKVLTTPAVRRIAAQFKVDLGTINPSGRNGRILKEDVLAHLNISADKSNEIPSALSVEAKPMPISIGSVKIEEILEDKIVPITGFTKAMVKSMTEAMKIPHFGLSDEYDVTKLVESRESLKVIAQERGVKLTYMPIIIKASSLALTAYPVLNSSLDAACENLTYKANHNIGIAMDTPNGLVVPVIKNVQHKTILDIARELNILQEKGTKGQLGLNDLSGGTFTLSNIGIVGGTYAKPVIVPPQVSIGALGKIQVLPRFNSEGEVTKSHILTVSWSADHRVVDGVTMARFSNALKQYLEDPYKLLLDI
ncbi:PREDICTED: lipoamide acyltransferase component of branched-chain alpha-keto acid dehydrogenase complex, mitochondrial isoform X1 [Papilio polytes]|uniref:lipoamide acyltransferase component of branched-chain alpha-keto acid dehydrogenase complex, mitochondrial isoform X1 n=1 Tax=Papilio polytes TaxID=76194 RepID=UPI0006763117|nr:PREDICTED: lipoamide acyltransferase component of branched-chain alpha-keto acid dehydrogenase complex, mitochondrial isoform X1 [Papilio polytes]